MSNLGISVHTNKAVLVRFVLPLSDGTLDTTTAAVLTVSDSSKFRATINPADSREFAIVGVGATLPSSPGSVSVAFGAGGPSDFISVAVVAPTKQQPSFGTPGGEVDIPSWA